MGKEKDWKKTGWYLMALEGDDLLIWDYRKHVGRNRTPRVIKLLHDSQAAYAAEQFLANRGSWGKVLAPGVSGQDSWATIEEAIKSLPASAGGPGITSKWSSDYIRKGKLVFTEGNYDVSQTVKHVPLCSYEGSGMVNGVPTIRAMSGFTDTYVVDGAKRNGSSANSNFQTSFSNIFIDANDQADVGMRWAASHGSLMSNVEIDRFNKVGLVLELGSDDWMLERFVISRLLNDDASDSASGSSWGIWCENTMTAGIMNSIVVTKVHTGISLGSTRGLMINGFETENVGLPIDFREKNSSYWDGTAGDFNGNVNGCRIVGIRARRNSADTVVDSDRRLAHVRISNSQLKDHILTLEGVVEDTAANLPYDRVECQIGGGSKFTFPLRWDRGIDRTDYDSIDFHFDLGRMLNNLRFSSDNAKMQDNRWVCSNNPATITADSTVSVSAEPGLYRIEVPAGNVYNGGVLTVYQYSGGPVVPGLNGISSSTDIYYHHPGGSMEVDFTGDSTSASSSVDIYFRPWFL